MPFDYSRFESIPDSSSESDKDSQASDGEAGLVDGTRSEEGLLRAFITLHERRLKADELRESEITAERAAEIYDDVSQRLLALDGVRQEASLRSRGHRAELVLARLGGAKAWLRAGKAAAAEERATLAINALRVRFDKKDKKDKKDTDAEDKKDKKGQSKDTEAEDGGRLIHVQAAEAHLFRGELRFRRGSYRDACEDALAARQFAREQGDKETTDKAGHLAVRCEMGMNAAGPGPDGKGMPLSPEDLEGMEIGTAGSYGIPVGRSGYGPRPPPEDYFGESEEEEEPSGDEVGGASPGGEPSLPSGAQAAAHASVDFELSAMD